MKQDWSLCFMWIMLFIVTYHPINGRNIFSNGDIVKGKVTLEVRKSCRIKSLSITFKAESKVEWSRASGDDFSDVYSSNEKYFEIKHFFIGGKNVKGDDSKTLLTHQRGETYSSVVAPGCHVYPVRFQIPWQNLPASYNGTAATVQYKLEAKLSRSMKRDKKHETEITFVPRQHLTNNFQLMMPQHMTVNKNLNLFNSGEISMDVKLEKSGFFQGERLKVVAYIVNNSSREITPQYHLIRKEICFAEQSRNVETKKVLKEVGEPIPLSTRQNITKVITIPQDVVSILNCSNVRVEYILRVFLDIKFASNPEILFPVVILLAPPVRAVAPPRGVSGFGAFGSTSPPTRGLVPSAPQLDDLPPPYESHGLLGHTFLGTRTLRDLSLYFIWIMDLKVTYNPINESSTFTNGETVTGQVTLKVTESCRINSLSIRFKVECRMQWDQDSAPEVITYHSEEKYFMGDRLLDQGKNLTDSIVVAPGCHVYPFSFQIPFQDLPASYNSSVAKILYILQTKLSRSMKRDKEHETEITFVPRRDLTNNLVLMKPQHMTVAKKVNLFNEKISMDVKLEKSAFFQGGRLKVVAYIVNNSSYEITPKYCLYRKRSYFTNRGRKVDTKNLVKEEGRRITVYFSQNVTQVIKDLTIPQDAEISILNCPNIRVEYKLRVYLDVRFASDPEVKFPVVILPTPQVPAVAPPPGVSDFGFGAFGSTSPPTRGLVPSSPQLDDLPPPYESHQFYPPLTDPGKK
ncbi:uncharacterized protein V6R79_008458 [Siganus canaliculatus]